MSFTVAAEDVSVLHDPAEFYDTLHTAMQLACHRVSLSSLYIGNGPLEQRLLDTLRSKVCECARSVGSTKVPRAQRLALVGLGTQRKECPRCNWRLANWAVTSNARVYVWVSACVHACVRAYVCVCACGSAGCGGGLGPRLCGG